VTRKNHLIALTPKEFAILEFLLYNKNHVLSRLTIAEHVWGDNFETMTNFVDVHIKNLRKKIDNNYSPKLIHTIRGIGDMLKEE
jgi:DNA-binding response OmpR family regulator